MMMIISKRLKAMVDFRFFEISLSVRYVKKRGLVPRKKIVSWIVSIRAEIRRDLKKIDFSYEKKNRYFLARLTQAIEYCGHLMCSKNNFNLRARRSKSYLLFSDITEKLFCVKKQTKKKTLFSIQLRRNKQHEQTKI